MFPELSTLPLSFVYLWLLLSKERDFLARKRFHINTPAAVTTPPRAALRRSTSGRTADLGVRAGRRRKVSVEMSVGIGPQQ